MPHTRIAETTNKIPPTPGLGSLKAGSYLASYQFRATGMYRDCHENALGLPRVCQENAPGIAPFVYRITTGMLQICNNGPTLQLRT